MFSEIKRLKQLKPRYSIKCSLSQHERCNAVLKQIGILKILSYKYEKKSQDESVIHWQVSDGISVDGKRYDDVLEDYDSVLALQIQKSFYGGITEAMMNSVNHAYIDKRKDGLDIANEKAQWWMFSQKKDGFLTVALCDLGIGIPNTLPILNKKWFSKLSEKLGREGLNDGECIKQAIIYSKSRTKESHQGKGLHNITNWITSFESASIAIFSNCGFYRLNGNQGEAVTSYFKNSILGTIISWKVPLPDEAYES